MHYYALLLLLQTPVYPMFPAVFYLKIFSFSQSQQENNRINLLSEQTQKQIATLQAQFEDLTESMEAKNKDSAACI